MKRSGSRTRATHSGAELSARRSQLGTALSSPKASFSSGLGSGSRTLIAFSSSVSSHGGHGGSVIAQKRVSAHLTPSGSASSMYRSAAGHGRALSPTEQAHLRMLSSRSDSVIHDMAHSSESAIAGPRTSGHALGVPLSIQITPVSSTIESMFESRAPRDQSLRNRARSGEGSGLFLERNVDENSLQAARRLSGSQARLTRMSFSRSAGSREDNRPIQELVEVDASGASSKERGFGSPPRSASFHGSNEPKRKPRGQSSSSVTETSIIPRGPSKEPHGSSSNKQKNDALTAASAERTSSPFVHTSSKGGLTSAFKTTNFESAKLSGSLLDKGRIAPTGLDATSVYESVIQRQEHDAVTTSHGDLKAPRLSSSGPDTRTTTESTKVGNQLRTGTATAIQEVVPRDVAVVEVRTITQSSSERENPQLSLTTKKTSAHGTGWSQQTMSSKLKVHETVGRTTSKTKPGNLPITGTKSRSQTFSVTQDLGNRELLTDSRAHTFAGPTEKGSFATSLLQKGTPSKTQHSVHGSNVVDNAPDALRNSATASLLYPTSLEKAASSHSMNQQSLFQTNLSLGKNFDTYVLTAAKAETSAPFSLTSSSVSEKTSKSLIEISAHPTSIPSNNTAFTSTATDASDKALGVVTNQDVSQRSLLDRPALTFLRSSDESRFLTSSPPRKTSSRTFTPEPVPQTVCLDRPAGSIEATSMNSTTSAFANQAEHLQDISEKPIGPATQDLRENAVPLVHGTLGETTSSHPSSCEPTHVVTSAPERTSSKSIIEESVRQTDVSAGASETSAFANQAEHLQDISDKPIGPATQDLRESAVPLVHDTLGETTSSHPNSCEPAHVVAFAPERTSSKSIIDESVRQTDFPAGASRTSAFANQAERLQDISDKPTAPATQDLRESAGPLVRVTLGETFSHPNSCEPTHVVTSAPERVSSKSIIEESMRQTDFSTGASEALVSAHAKDETSSSSVPDLVKQTPIQTGLNNYSLSAGAQMTMTKKVNTRWSVSEPVQHSFFERVEGSKYQTFDNTRRSQVPSSGVVSDFQTFEVTTSREPAQAVAEIPCEHESQAQAARDLNAEYISAHKEKGVEQKAGSSTATALTPLPELSLNGSTPKASSEEIRSSETEPSVSKAIDRDDALHWPLINAGVRSTRLGEAAALFEASSDGTQADHRRIQVEFSDDRDMIETGKHEDREAGYEDSSACEVAMQEGPAPALVSELPAESQMAPIKYGTEPEEEAIAEVKEQPRMDSSLIQYTPDDYILAQIVREVEKKIEASSRYHYEPLPDDVLTIRSSKGIESLGLLRYETYEEELLLRHSEDDLTKEQEKPKAEASEQSATAIEEPVAALDQEGYAGVLEEFYESAEKLSPEPEPEGLVDAGAPPSGDIHEEAKMKIENYTYAVITETEKKSNAISEEQERQKCEYAENKEAEDKEPFHEKSFDDIREERRRQFEQRWMDVPVVTERETTKATVKDREALETAHGAPLTTAQAESAETREKVFVSKQEAEHSSENAVRRFIAAAIEEAAKREEATKSVKRFREYPCSVSVEDASRKTFSDSSDTSASDLASRKEEERRLADMKVQQKKDKTIPQLVRCRSIAELIEQIIQQHVSGTDVRKDGHACEKQGLAQDFISAQAPVFPTSMVQQEIPVYYQTETTTQKRGEQHVADHRYSLLGVSRKSDTHLEANSHSERRFSFSTLGGRGAKCVIRKLEPGALTYIVEVAPADKNQENQTDMVMAEEQMLVSEIFDQITAPTLRVSSSGSRLNETATINLSPSASLTAIRNAYAQAVARRVLGKQSPQDNEGVLSASQRAKFYENKQGVYDQKSSSSTSVSSAPSVEDYIVQRMVEGGVIRNHRELWGREPLKFENIIVSRAGSMGSTAKTNASSEAMSTPPPKPHDVKPADAELKGAENYADAAGQTPKEEASSKVEAPREATFKAARDEAAAAPNFAGEKQAVAEGSVDSHERGHFSAFASSEATTAESQRTAAVTATAPTDQQRSEMKQASAEGFTCKVRTASSECINCRNRIAPEKSFESFICFGLHELPKFFVPVPFDVSETIKLRIATDEDVREIMSLSWREPESVYTLHAAIVTRHLLCPSSFFVAVDTSRDVICGTASALLFDEEVAFCGFFHILEKYPFEHVGTLLWNELLHVTSGKNLFTVLPEPAYQELQKIYPFPSNPATGILFGPVRMSRAAFSRTVLVLEYKDKYFDALASYDKHVFGFSRKRYLASSVHEVGLDIRVATRNERNICGYGGMQRGSAGCLVLRWLFADDAETAQSLLSSLLASCSHEDEVDVAAAFFLRSISTRPILDKISTRQLKPWRLVYTKREPLHSYGRVVCLTTV